MRKTKCSDRYSADEIGDYSVGVRFKPQPPFDQYGRGRVLSHNKCGEIVHLWNDKNDKVLISLIRYRAAVVIGRKLTRREVVSFNNRNSTDFSPDNIAIKILGHSRKYKDAAWKNKTLETLKENPEPGVYFLPEAPWQTYPCGITRLDTRRDDSGRMMVILFGDFGVPNKIMTCARYLKQVETFKNIGVIVPAHIHAHHIDHNRRNDTLNNIEWKIGVLHSSEHTSKEAVLSKFICPVCNTLFDKKYFRIDLLKSPSCCSTRCRIILDTTLQPAEKYADIKLDIIKNQIVSIAIRKNTIIFNVQELIDKQLNYGEFCYATEAEKICMIRDALARNLDTMSIATLYRIPAHTVEFYTRLGKLRERIRIFVFKIRDELKLGRNKKQIAYSLGTTQSNISQFISRNRENIYPL